MKSMTGFALVTQPLREGRLVMELRTLNHRYLDARVRLPSELTDHAFFLEQHLRAHGGRGRYDLSLRLEGQALAPPVLDEERVRGLYAALARLGRELGLRSELPLTAVTALPGALNGETAPAAREELRGALELALEAALAELDRSREREGAELQRELRQRTARAKDIVQRLEHGSAGGAQRQRERLRERLSRLLDDVELRLDEGRLEQELAVLADKTDITEELVRLKLHLSEFERCLALSGPVGRQLDFVLQELGREANTVGSKLQDAEQILAVVELKAELERLREQVQNVE